MEDIDTFTALEETSSRAGDDDTGEVEGTAEEEHVETSHCTISLNVDVWCVHIQEKLPTHVHTSLAR